MNTFLRLTFVSLILCLSQSGFSQSIDDMESDERGTNEGPGRPMNAPQGKGGEGMPGRMEQGGRPMMGGMGGPPSNPVIAVGEGSVFIISQGELHKYDEKTLKLEQSVSLSAAAPSTEVPPRFSQGKMSSKTKGSTPSEGKKTEGGNNPPMGPRMMSGEAIAVANGYAFVIYHGKLLKFNTTNLELISNAELPSHQPKMMPGNESEEAPMRKPSSATIKKKSKTPPPPPPPGEENEPSF
jgi:hypothetical protein